MLNVGFCQETGTRIWLSYPGEGLFDLRLFCLIILLLLRNRQCFISSITCFHWVVFKLFIWVLYQIFVQCDQCQGQQDFFFTRLNEKQLYITQPSSPMRCTGPKISRALVIPLNVFRPYFKLVRRFPALYVSYVFSHVFTSLLLQHVFPSKAPCRKHTFSTVTALWLATFRDYPWSLYFVENFCKWRTNSSSLNTSGIMDSTWYGEGEHFVRHAFWCGEIQCSDWRLRSGGGMKKSTLLLTLYRTASVKAYGPIGLLTAVQRKIFTEKLRRVLKSWGCQFHCFNYQLTVN